jgi:putative sigma-54 modulation protein
MTVTIKGVHYEISDRTREFLTDKLGLLDPFKELLVSVDATITKEKAEFVVESNVHFRWGTNAHLEERAQELYPAIENLIHKLDAKISKEKEKVQNHHPKEKEKIPE